MCQYPGTGKTALAVHWAHQVASRFPDGQLYVNLRGYDPGQPMPPADALAAFLRALGVPGHDIPADTGERAARYRSLLAGRRMLVLLDNAGSAEQVRPLLPACPACLTLVTSRDTLAGLAARDGARRLDLDLLAPADAAGLLTTLIGDRAAADPAATAALATACARLPLALRVAAELASIRPATALPALVAELADEQQRLDLLDADGDPYTAVRAVFSWSYQHLDESTASTFRRLGLHPGPDFEPYAVAALTGGTLEESGRHLDLLVRAHLIHPTQPGRYGLHDLLRAYARELAASEDGPDASHAALTRLFDHYLSTALAAVTTLHSAERDGLPDVPAATGPAPPVATEAEAKAWLEAQLPTLVAIADGVAGHGWPGHTVLLSKTLFRHLDITGHFAEAGRVHGRAVDAAHRSGDGAAETRCLNQLCIAYMRQGRFAEATGHLQQALALTQQIGDRTDEAHTCNNLGIAEASQGHYDQAVGYFQRSIAWYRESGERRPLARTLSNIGQIEMRQGHSQEATAHLQEALTLLDQTEHDLLRANIMAHLGAVEFRQGHYPGATGHLEQALATYREIGNPGEIYALTYIGAVESRQGRHQEAVGHVEQALAVSQACGDRALELEALNVAGDIHLAAGQPAEAEARYEAALPLASELDEKYELARAHHGLGLVRFAGGDLDRARSHWERALVRYADMGTPEAEDVRARLESCLAARTG